MTTLDNPFVELAAEHQTWLGGDRYAFTFRNGYGASVVRYPADDNRLGSYGNGEGRWELAVLDEAGEVVYNTPVTANVKGFLDVREVRELLRAIGELPARSQ